MKKVLFATTNESKSKRFSKELLKMNIEVLNLKDLELTLNVEENGKDVGSNVLIKAREAYKEAI